MGKKTMSRRERVITALEHREPDRVPLDMSITVPAYQALKKHMGIDLQEDLYPGHWTDVPIHPEVADKFGLDIVWLRMSGGKSAKPFDLENPPDKRVDGWGIEWTRIDQDPGLYYYEMSKHPLADVTIEDLDDYPWPDPYDSKHTEGLHDYLKYIHEETDFAILTKFGGAMFETAWYLRGMEKFFMDLVNNKPFVQKLLEKIYYVQKGLDEVGIAAAGEYVDILRLSGEDLGTQEAPLISMRMFREQLKPWLHKLWTYAKTEVKKKNPRAQIMLHSCGAVRTFIPEWIDMGLEILDPIQPNAKGMDPFDLKRDFGDKLTFHGGIDAQYVLPFGTPEEVREATKTYIQALAPGGGYIVAPVHNVQGDVSPENLIAMRDAVEEYGYYPLKF